MRFGPKVVPASLFKLARDRMLAQPTFSEADIRQHLLDKAKAELATLSPEPSYQWLITTRVLQTTLRELAKTGDIARGKRGLWEKVDTRVAANTRSAYFG